MNNMKNRKLKLYVNESLLDERLNYSQFLFPFWGPILRKNKPYKRIFKRYNFDTRYYTLVESIENADYVLLPYEYWNLKKMNHSLLKKIEEEAKGNGKPLLIEGGGDIMHDVPNNNAVILRGSKYRSQLKDNEIIIPNFAEDLLELYFNSQLKTRQKYPRPSVGFTGWANLKFKDFPLIYLKDIILKTLSLKDPHYQIFRKGVFLRKEITNVLHKSSLVSANFILRNTYSGNIKLMEKDPQTMRQEFVENIVNNDYSLTIKGDGNYSLRFYEILSLGRIPLFIDTECVLPLEDIIDYTDFCVFINYKEMNKTDEILKRFHENITDEQFLYMQKRAREVYQNYLRIDNFTKYLVIKLKQKAKEF